MLSAIDVFSRRQEKAQAQMASSDASATERRTVEGLSNRAAGGAATAQRNWSTTWTSFGAEAGVYEEKNDASAQKPCRKARKNL